MRNRTLLFAAMALNLAIIGAACSSARGNEDRADGRASGSGDMVTIAGCLNGAPDGRFVLTAAPDAAVAAAERATSDERSTHSYVLIGGDNLQAHLGRRVEVTGTVSGPTRELDHDATSRSSTAPQGRQGTPTVETREEVEVEVRQLTVREVRPLAQNCDLTQ